MEPSQPSLLYSVQPSSHMDTDEPAREMCEKVDLKRESLIGEKTDPPCKKPKFSLLSKPSQIFKSSGSMNPRHHGLHPSPPTDAIASITEMYKNMYSDEQTDHLISFIDRFISFIKNQPYNINSKSEVEEWVANVRDGTDIGAKTLDIISKEIGELSKSVDPGSSTENVIRVLGQMRVLGHMHVAFIGLSIVAFAAKSYLKVASVKTKCKDLLMKILELALDVKEFCHAMPDEREKQWKAVGIIVEGGVHCCRYLNQGTTKKYWWAQRADALLQKINEQLADVKQALSFSVMTEVKKQLPSRRPRSWEGLLEFIPVGIEDQVEDVKALLDMDGSERALAVNICGVGGTGKSTVALSVVQSLCSSFSGVRSFMWCVVSVEETPSDKKYHMMKLQNVIIYDFGGYCNCDLRDPSDGRQEIEKLLRRKDSLLLLLVDNLVQKDDIRHLLPKDLQPGNEGAKLRIIITSGQRNVNEELNIICKEYEVKGLSDTHSKSLLRETIMQNRVLEENQVVNWDEESEIQKVALACKRVPLLLTAVGKYLRVNRNEQSYQELLKLLEKGDFYYFPDENLGKRLMFTYHEIKDVDVKDLFRDCCTKFHGMEWNDVAKIVEFRKLEDLRRRMLVSKSEGGQVIVPEILQLMEKKLPKSTR